MHQSDHPPLFITALEQVLQHNGYHELDESFCQSNYYNIVQSYVYYLRDKINNIFKVYPTLSIPIGFEPIKHFFSGFEFYFVGLLRYRTNCDNDEQVI
jgi:hypothetical protein